MQRLLALQTQFILDGEYLSLIVLLRELGIHVLDGDDEAVFLLLRPVLAPLVKELYSTLKQTRRPAGFLFAGQSVDQGGQAVDGARRAASLRQYLEKVGPLHLRPLLKPLYDVAELVLIRQRRHFSSANKNWQNSHKRIQDHWNLKVNNLTFRYLNILCVKKKNCLLRKKF